MSTRSLNTTVRTLLASEWCRYLKMAHGFYGIVITHELFLKPTVYHNPATKIYSSYVIYGSERLHTYGDISNEKSVTPTPVNSASTRFRNALGPSSIILAHEQYIISHAPCLVSALRALMNISRIGASWETLRLHYSTAASAIPSEHPSRKLNACSSFVHLVFTVVQQPMHNYSFCAKTQNCQLLTM
jgi:hypothetical protein